MTTSKVLHDAVYHTVTSSKLSLCIKKQGATVDAKLTTGCLNYVRKDVYNLQYQIFSHSKLNLIIIYGFDLHKM